jgi:hypothetical protein
MNPTLFWSKVDRRGDDECWMWTGARSAKGYGHTRDGLAHRAAFRLVVGEIPDGYQLHHRCGTKACVNPRHLTLVTSGEHADLHDNGWWHAAKTHCPHGHPYDEANTYVSPSGARHCRICHQAAKQRHKLRHG